MPEIDRPGQDVPTRPPKVLVTGAGGFIGSCLVPTLADAGWEGVPAGVALNDRASAESWHKALAGMDAVIHLAGIAHRRASAGSLTRVNERWPVALYRAADRCGVKSFVWLSSIKVLGDVSSRPLVPTDPYHPGDDYARSKARAEQQLTEAAAVAGTALAIVRPPLVYGPGVKANFAALLRLAELSRRGLPLPLGDARAPRSLIGLRNLCSLIVAALGHEGIYHCSDDRDPCVAELLVLLGARLLLPVPAGVMARLAALTGQRAIYQRLFEPLQVDSTATRRALGWQAPFSLEQGLEETVRWFRQRR